MTERDLRGLTPLFWGNVLHGIFALDLAKRLDYDRVTAADELDDDLRDESDGDELVSTSQHRRREIQCCRSSDATRRSPERGAAAALVRVVPSRPRWSCSFVLAVPV